MPTGARLRPSRAVARVRRALRPFTARPRLLGAGIAGVALYVVLPSIRPSTRLLIAWDFGIIVHVALAWTMMAMSSYADLQRRADKEDAGAVVVLGLAMLASVASLVAIGAELQGVKEAPGGISGWRMGLAGSTILFSWLFVHTIFALHYAHDYYAGEDDRGGLQFPNESKPDYWDFLYFSFNMGAASQTSDVAVVAKRMRRFVLAHTILSFLFNTTVLALAINVGASML